MLDGQPEGNGAPPERSLSDRRKRRTLLACILGSSVVFLDGTLVNVALPAIRADLHGGLVVQEWVVDAYLLTLGSLILVGGSLGDVFGRRRVFAAGIAGFGAASLLCALAPDGGLLIAARALQGVAGALLVPSTLALIMDTFSEHERAAAIGAWTGWTGIAIVLGPLVGGDARPARVVALDLHRQPPARGGDALAGRARTAQRTLGRRARGLAGRGALRTRPGRPDLRPDRAAALRLVRWARLGAARRRLRTARGVRRVGAARAQSDAAVRALQGPQLQRWQRRDPVLLRRPRVDHVLPGRLPPAGRGLLSAPARVSRCCPCRS